MLKTVIGNKRPFFLDFLRKSTFEKQTFEILIMIFVEKNKDTNGGRASFNDKYPDPEPILQFTVSKIDIDIVANLLNPKYVQGCIRLIAFYINLMFLS